MSVECELFIGLTVELERDVKDFSKVTKLTKIYPYLEGDPEEGSLRVIEDGMCGEFVRIINIDKYVDGGSLGDGNEFIELPINNRFNPELINKMASIYKDYTGFELNPKDIKYAIWSRWY